MNQRAKKWITFSLRWGIAVVGIWLVLRQISLYDRVWVIQNNQLVSQRLWQSVSASSEQAQEYRVYDPADSAGKVIPRSTTANKPEKKEVALKTNALAAQLIGVDLSGDLSNEPKLVRLYVVENGQGRWISPSELTEPYTVRVPYPRVDIGLIHMARQASPILLILSVLIFPITYIVTSFRWHRLLKALDIHLTLARTFVLNMVGAFYNTFLLGSTGGDVVKAIYASKQTPHRTRAFMSVFVDRVVGLLALLIMGGVMAAYQYFTGGPGDASAHACGKIAILCGLIVFGTAAGLFVFYHPTLRRVMGLDWFISKLPKQKQVKNAIETMNLYRTQKWLVLQSLVVTFPVHITVVLSAMLAGKAFGLGISPLYYFVAVPVIVLVGSIPISPQGAGVMEYFAIILLGRQGGTVGQAFALTMSIRMVQILWNLTGGIFVFRGGYHQPTEAEQRDLGEDELAAARAA